MTWVSIFSRAVRVCRARLARQHMCPLCGDACEKRAFMDYGGGYSLWICAGCGARER